MNIHVLDNKTIRLRAVEPDDLEVIHNWENDTSVWYLSNTLTPFSKYTIGKYIETAAQDIYEAKQLRLIIEHKDENRPVGAIDLFDFDAFNQRAGLGILISKKEDRKKGFASEALDTLITYSFNILILKQLYCNITENNTDSLQLFIRHGFVITGQKQSWIKTPKNWLTEYFLQLIRE
ncbi:MAG TPA: GNAT family protein [Bacteroidales bacterium]|nr:GNAT family protein [Bacteroidales bacterium]